MRTEASRLIERLAAAVWGGAVSPASREADGFDFAVDGIRVSVRALGTQVRLACTLGPALPEEEPQARALLAGFLPYADAGPELICADGAGRVLLIADLEPEADAEQAVGRFADAAVHWTARLARLAEPPIGRGRPAAGQMMIIP